MRQDLKTVAMQFDSLNILYVNHSHRSTCHEWIIAKFKIRKFRFLALEVSAKMAFCLNILQNYLGSVVIQAQVQINIFSFFFRESHRM